MKRGAGAAVLLLVASALVGAGSSVGRAQPGATLHSWRPPLMADVARSSPARRRPLDITSRDLFRPPLLHDTAPRGDGIKPPRRVANRVTHIAPRTVTPPPPRPVPVLVVAATKPERGHLLERIEWCESRGHNDPPSAGHPAAGYFQFEPAPWREWSHLKAPASAYDYATQRAAAASMLAADGTRPWNSSRFCWQ